MGKGYFKYFAVCLFALLLFSGCQSKDKALTDGTYQGVSTKDDEGAYAKVKIEIENKKIKSVAFETIQKDGSIKDAEYGKKNGEIADQNYYNKAQIAVKAMETYRAALESKQSIDEVEVVSGATISYNQFKEAVKDALK